MHIGHMTPHALSCFENLLTKFTLQARMCDVESFDVPRHITLKLELLATVEATPHRPPYGIHYSCHVRSDQGIKIVEPCKQMSRQKTKPQSSSQQEITSWAREMERNVSQLQMSGRSRCLSPSCTLFDGCGLPSGETSCFSQHN